MSEMDKRTINTIRLLAVEAVEKAKSGHPGLPLGAAPMAYTLWSKIMKHNPKNPKWYGRDRFILSAGHGSALLYSLMSVLGYDISVEDLKSFRQWGSKTPGHPENIITNGVEVTTGPLGQGIANAVGMAIAERYLASIFNINKYNIIDNYTYALCGDGCLMEGISYEAASLAGTLQLGKLIVMYDSNNITIEGNTSIAFTENVAKRFEAMNWEVLTVNDGNNVEEIFEALEKAKKNTEKPSIIIIRTKIGYGCKSKEGTAAAHGEPLGRDNVKDAREFFQMSNREEFTIPEDVKIHTEIIQQKLQSYDYEWDELLKSYKENFPEFYKRFTEFLENKIDLNINEDIFKDVEKMSTRNASGKILNQLVALNKNIIGGSADLAPSNKTYLEGRGDFSKDNYIGRNLHFGIREHAMGAIANGIALYGGLKVFVSTFLVFADYMKPAMRLSSLMNLPVVYVLTHDSIGVGEDGPTHQPIEHLTMLRSIPNMTVIRPADCKETLEAYKYALNKLDGPTSIILSRQDLKKLQYTGNGADKGAYELGKCENPDVILMASGSEVDLIEKASQILLEKNIKAKVVSIPSMEIFDSQPKEYIEEVLPNNLRKRVAVEAAKDMPWYKYVGLDGELVTLDRFGESAPAEILFKEFNITVEEITKKVEKAIK